MKVELIIRDKNTISIFYFIFMIFGANIMKTHLSYTGIKLESSKLFCSNIAEKLHAHTSFFIILLLIDSKDFKARHIS